MSFVVETGDGLETSTSYVDIDFADTYADTFFSDADFDTWEYLALSSKQRILNRSSAYIDRTYVFLGQKSSASQALQFPRDYLYDVDENEVTGVPIVIKQAVCLIAKRLMNSVDVEPDLDRGGRIKREKIDTIDITYADGASAYTRFTEVDNLLKSSGYIQSNRNSSANIKLTKS